MIASRKLANAPIDAIAMVNAIGRVVPSNVAPTTNAAVEATANWQKEMSDDALPAMSGNGVNAPAVAGGIVIMNATMNTNIGTTIVTG